ncbi:hypothetical protein CARUB_v10002676mg [Capsella rubella]|uniref:Uncharacterized protein n=2 Tax=Capsella rubella TaxID=81985 RepID=R0HED0_9BRAS|nr:hypothetical protein CARUB_v10002676mg [Capsella rubella]
MKLVILVSFLLVLPMFSSGLVETLQLDNVKHEVMNGKRIDLELDYTDPRLSPSVPSDDPIGKNKVVTKERPVHIKDDYTDPSLLPIKNDYMDPTPRPVFQRPQPSFASPPPPPSPRLKSLVH